MMAVSNLITLLRKHWPTPKCEVAHSNPWELLVGVILSAQSTDKRVNELTKTLFKKYRTVADYAGANPLEFERDIHAAGFFRSKTKSIMGAARVVLEKFGGQVPKTMDELLQLPGIGRKSANVILGASFGIASGIVVDTHMIRLAQRFQFSKSDDPVKIEQDLMKIVPKKDWIYFSQAMVLHGRYICVARKPRCFECYLVKSCPFADKVFEPTPDAFAERTTITGIPIRRRMTEPSNQLVKSK